MPRLTWGSKSKIDGRIQIYKAVQDYNDKGEPCGSEKEKVGHLGFMNKEDVVRFGLHVAKNCGIGPQKFAKLANEVMNEMGDWD